MLISESFMSKFSCHPVHIKAHSRYHTVHLGSRECAMQVMVGRVYASALRDGLHMAYERVWIESERLCMLYSAGSMGTNVRVAVVRILTISWPEDQGGGGATIASTRCACTSAPKVDGMNCQRRSAEEWGWEWGSAETLLSSKRQCCTAVTGQLNGAVIVHCRLCEQPQGGAYD